MGRWRDLRSGVSTGNQQYGKASRLARAGSADIQCFSSFWSESMRLLAVLPILILTSCSDSPSRDELLDQVAELEHANDQLRSEAESLQQQLEDAQSAASDANDAASRARDAAEEVASQAERFQREDWRYVMHDMQEAADEAVSAANDAASEADDAYSSFNY